MIGNTRLESINPELFIGWGFFFYYVQNRAAAFQGKVQDI